MPVEPATPKTPAAKTPRARTVSTIGKTRTVIREEALAGIGQMLSLGAVMKGWYADAGAIAQHGPALCHELALMGESNEQVASWLDYLTQAGPAMGLMKAGLPLIMQFAANHGRLDVKNLPPEAGIIEPELLEKKVRAEMEVASASILAEIRQLEKKAAEARQVIQAEAM